jgi:hypothetical protein
MNCKPGDLAVIVRGSLNLGRFVEVLAPLGVEPEWGGYVWNIGTSKGQFCWLVRSAGEPLSTVAGVSFVELPIADSALRPIRDQPGADETLTWKDVPAPIKTPEPA